MLNLTKICFIFILFFSQHVISQQLEGTIYNVENEPIPATNVLIKKSVADSTIIAYSISDQNGHYSINLKPNLDFFIIEFKSLSYKTKRVNINNFSNSKKPYLLKVTLEKDLTKLEEVIVKSKKRPIIVKNDTTTYNIKAFMDGREKVVEDLIKKLPGINVDKNGKITFKGNSVQSVLLDGDNLFDQNYTIGTKNIDIDMVEKISAIENYIENPLLHGISNTNTVALNLELKKGKTDFSNTSNVALGIENRADIKSSVLGVSKKLKSFSTITYNNIGKEYSPYDYFSPNNLSSNNNDFGEFNDENPSIKKVIQEFDFSSEISAERSRINSNLFTSLNGIYNITKKLDAKINIDLKKDNLERNLFLQTNYLTNGNNSDVNQNEIIEKKPELFNTKLNLHYKISKSESLESSTALKKDKTDSNSFINLNEKPQESTTQFSEKAIKQKLKYTKRISSKSALISTFTFNNIKLDQSLLVLPDSRINNSIEENESNQLVNIKSNNLNFSNYYFNSSSNYNFKLGVGYTFEKSDFSSSLTINNIKEILSVNKFDYQKSYPWLTSELFFKVNKWSFRPNITAIYLNQGKENTVSSSEFEKIVLLPKLTVIYNFNDISNIKFVGKYNEKPTNVNLLYEHIIFTSNRNIQNNSPTLKTRKNYGFDLRYRINDFFNLFQFDVGINYQSKINSLQNKILINEPFLTNTRGLVNSGSENISMNSGVDSYVDIIKSNVKFNFTYGINTYNNIVNNSENRRNKINFTHSELNLKTGFLGMLNFENNLQFSSSVFNSKRTNSISNSSLRNVFNIYLKPTKRLFFSAGFDYYLPDVNKKNNFLFFDTALTFSSKNSNIEYSIISKNITAEESVFTRTDISDFSRTTSSYNLLKPYLLFSVNFKL